MQRVIYLLFLFSAFAVYSQNSEYITCKLEKDNKLWKIQFANASTKAQRIILIKDKIISDSIYREIQPVIKTAHGPILNYEDPNGNDCGCKIQFILKVIDGTWYELNLNKKPELINLLADLDSNNLENIYYDLSENKQTLNTGSRCGLVKLTTRDSLLKRMIKNVW